MRKYHFTGVKNGIYFSMPKPTCLVGMRIEKNSPLPRECRSLILFLLLVLILPNGCSKNHVPADQGFDSTTLPSYKPGTTYVYSNGSWETVVDVSSQLLKWQDHRGRVYRRLSDFTYRPTTWESSTRRIHRRFVRRSDSIAPPSTSLWPLQKGNLSNYSELVTSKKSGEAEKSYRVDWACEVNDTERVAVIAGDFDTWKITCKRMNRFQNPSKARVLEKRTWYYAPEIEHYVLTERWHPGGDATRRLELVAVLPPLTELPDEAKRQMRKAFQAALEFNKRGEAKAWSAPNTLWSGLITPTDTFKLADGRFCRRYVQRLNYLNESRFYFGLAVRDARGIWIIPRR